MIWASVMLNVRIESLLLRRAIRKAFMNLQWVYLCFMCTIRTRDPSLSAEMLRASEWCSAVAKGSCQSDFAFADSSWKTLLHLIKLLPSFLFFMVVRATVPHSLFTFIFYISMINGRCRTVEWASISEGEIIISLADAGPSNGASGWKNYPIGSWRRPKTFYWYVVKHPMNQVPLSLPKKLYRLEAKIMSAESFPF